MQVSLDYGLWILLSLSEAIKLVHFHPGSPQEPIKNSLCPTGGSNVSNSEQRPELCFSFVFHGHRRVTKNTTGNSSQGDCLSLPSWRGGRGDLKSSMETMSFLPANSLASHDENGCGN